MRSRGDQEILKRCMLKFAFIVVFLLVENTPSVLGVEQRVQIQFVPRGELTTNEVTIVIQLARKVGIDDLESIYTGYVLPSTNLFVAAKEKETREDRKVSFRRLYIGKQGWNGDGPSADKPVRIGNFWVDRVLREERTVLKVREFDFQIDLRDGIAPETAERILSSFQSGEISFGDQSLEEQVQRIDFSKPRCLAKAGDGDMMRISFTSKQDPAEWFSIHFTFDKDHLKIGKIICVIV